ncbi:Uncharacterized protein dnl_04940 [Desulfonema limicola]|uniref:Uncharacterized protein n=1 Tax=Desulfonema limicola TaxID=45656 RepID=A0A975B3T5_9BACT|nr:Uncharacterized protein dnl_04940 [Desulfonema limicola]
MFYGIAVEFSIWKMLCKSGIVFIIRIEIYVLFVNSIYVCVNKILFFFTYHKNFIKNFIKK